MPFFIFDQNNSYGVFDVNSKVSYHVIVEADTASDANDKAESIGIYFDGDDDDDADGADCPCCGPRWYMAYGEGKELPMHYSTVITNDMLYDGDDDNDNYFADTKTGYIYYADGTRKLFRC